MFHFRFKFTFILNLWISSCHGCEHMWGQTSFDLDFLKENSTETRQIEGLASDSLCAIKASKINSTLMFCFDSESKKCTLGDALPTQPSNPDDITSDMKTKCYSGISFIMFHSNS